MDPNANLKEIFEILFCDGDDYDRVLELIEALAGWLAKDGFEPDETTYGTWHEVLIGAYWFCVEHHGGQWSDEYRVQCVIGQVYRPGPICNGPEPDSCESMVYGALRELSGFSDYDDECAEALDLGE